MLAVVRKPHTEEAEFKIIGHIDNEMLSYITTRFGGDNVDIDEEIVDVTAGAWYKKMSKKVTPGKVVRIYRENCEMTQKQLADKVGVGSAAYISDIENGRRMLSKNLIAKLSGIFKVSPELFY